MQKIELPINKNESSPINPDFNWGFKMLGILVGFITFSYLIFLGFSKVILTNINLETEKKWFGDIAKGKKFNYKEYSDYNINEFEKYNFNIEENPEINAYAFIGGNINITTGFLKNIENQEELIFVMAHEMGHVKNRDVLKAFSTEIPLKLTLLSLGIDIGIGNSSAVDIGGKFLSKNTETSADEIGLGILEKNKINPLCVIPFFKREHNFSDSVMEMMSDHPLNSSRIKNLENLAKKMGFKDKKNCKKLKNIVDLK